MCGTDAQMSLDRCADDISKHRSVQMAVQKVKVLDQTSKLLVKS